MSIKLAELKKLHDKGFALIYLRPNSKRPFENGWTKNARKEWAELESSFEKSYNVGVRLGAPSKLITGNYLAAIDCDVKSKSRRAVGEMNAKLRELGIDLISAPIVMSGRGNGSKHVYVQTTTPLTPRKFAKSTLEVKVLMPGETRSHSNYEKENLTEDELRQGYRLRPAWEISLMGTGQQTVLPPSTHPDTGFKYDWASPFSVKYLPVFNPPQNMPERVKVTDPDAPPFDFKPVEVDVGSLKVRQEIKDLIVGGADIGTRSDVIMKVSLALCRSGLSDNEILSVLSDPNNLLSEAAYERRGKNRKSAVDWLYHHTLINARKETDPMRHFENPPAAWERVALDEVEVKAQKQDIEQTTQDDAARSGYYTRGKNGGLKPDYVSLLKVFEKENPYKMIADMKAVYVFRETHYVDCTPFEIKAFAERKFCPKPEDRPRQEFLHKVHANNVVRRSFFYDTTEGKINFKNGVLTLGGSSKLQPHSPKYGFRNVLPYGYDPKATCPFFKSWIKDIMLEDIELTKILQEFMGYIVRGGDYKYHKALWLGGVGRNGKSTFIDILKALIGAGNFSVLSIKTLTGDKFAGADLDGKIANFSEETSPDELKDSGPFKNLTGDGDIFAQKKYGDPYNFRNKAKLVMTYNRIPDLKDLSSGMLSRPLIIPFKKNISEWEQDRGIKQKLLEELPGIFNYAMRGWYRLEKQGGFTQSEVSDQALQTVKEESCNVFQWVENHIQISPDPDTKVMARQLYTAYSRHERFPYSEREFFRRLKTHPFMEKKRKRVEDGIAYLGIGFV